MKQETSRIITPPGVEAVGATGPEPEEEATATQLPEPTGYKLLIALPEVSDKTEGGIAKANETKLHEEVATICGYVLAIGPDAYKDKKRFPGGPYCKLGDWVLMRAYSGTRFKIHGRELRLINDDSIEAVVGDPRGIAKL